MPTRQQLRDCVLNYIEHYNARNLDAVVALFADNATLEDPVGTPAAVGREAIYRHYVQSLASGAVLQLSGPIHATEADYVAFSMFAIIPMGQDMRFDVIETYRVDEAGKITELRAYFGPDNLFPSTVDNALSK